MRSLTVSILALATAAGATTWLACGNGNDSSAPFVDSDSDASVSGGGGVVLVTPVTGRDAGTSADSGAGANDGSLGAGDGGDLGDADLDSGPPSDPFLTLCTSFAFTGGRRADLTTPNFATFGGVTASTRFLAWTDTSGQLFVGTRPNSSSTFTSAAVGTPTTGSATAFRAAIDSAGTAIYVTAPDGKSLQVYTRAVVGADFAAVSTTGLTALNAQLGELGGTVSAITVGSYAPTMFLLVSTASGSALYESTYSSSAAAWSTATLHPESALASASTTALRIPSGLSYDGETLFYVDQTTGTEHVASRPLDSGAFTSFSDIGAFLYAAPDQTCGGVYYVSTDSSGTGIFTTFPSQNPPDASSG